MAEATAAAAAALQMKGISKAFSGVRALRGVNLTVRAGEVLALVGENGAGKSTLLKILSGAHAPDDGTIRIDGEAATFAAPVDARARGIRVVAQEPEIMPHLSFAENVYVGALPSRGRLVDRAQLRADMLRLIEQAGFARLVDPDLLGGALSPAQRQIVEILRALAGNPRVIAFDEPTSSLSDRETDALFGLIRRLQERGVAIIYVSHRLKEIFAIATRIMVLRDGQLAGETSAAESDEAALVRMMVGRDLSSLFARSERRPGRVVLSVSRLTTADVFDISFEVRAGEVVVLAGLVGAGRTELARALIGDLPITGGEIHIEGASLALRSPRDAIRAGLCLAPEERKSQALLMKRSVRDNITLAILRSISRFRIVRRQEERRIAAEYAQRLQVRTPSLEFEVAKLSGGNQQKTVLARWLASRSKLFMLDEPTRGVDVGAKTDIYAIIDQLAREGAAILVISSELPEALGLADRIIVMRHGRIAGELSRTEATEEKILRLAILEDAAA